MDNGPDRPRHNMACGLMQKLAYHAGCKSLPTFYGYKPKEGVKEMNKTTKVFFDTEFTGLHKDTSLLSIGLVDELNNKFYAESSIDTRETFLNYADLATAQWVQEHVIPNFILKDMEPNTVKFDELDHTKYVYGAPNYIANELRLWFSRQFDVPGKTTFEMWSDCLAYDWVLFCDLFGGAMKVPSNIYYIPFDICTLFKTRGVDPDINREEFAGITGPKHNALHDAKVIKACYEKLTAFNRVYPATPDTDNELEKVLIDRYKAVKAL